MDIFSRNNFLIRIVAILIFINVVTLGYLWWQTSHHHPGPPPGRPPREAAMMLSEELGFDKKQQGDLRKIRMDFITKEQPIDRQIREQRDSINAEIFKSNPDTLLLKALAERISGNVYRMELLRAKQAQQLKHICTTEQLEALDNVAMELREYFHPRPERR